MKRFMYLSISILALVVAALIVNNLTTRKAEAQSGQTIVAYAYDFETILGGTDRNRHFVITANGDVYENEPGVWSTPDCNGNNTRAFNCPPVYIGNFWMGTSPVATSPETWGKIKSQYNPK